MTGIEETKDVIEFVKDLATVIGEAKADGRLDILDAVKALKLAPSLTAAIKGADQIRAELSDLSGEEKDQLLTGLKEAIFKLVEALT